MSSVEVSDKKYAERKLSLIQKISPMNKIISIQFIILSLASVSSFLLVYYLTYQDYITDLIRNNILPYNLKWMLYTSAGIFIICIALSIFGPISERFFIVQEILLKEREILDEADNLINKLDFQQARELIESYLDERYKYGLKKNKKNILNKLKIAQSNESMNKYIDYLSKLYEEERKFELKKEYDILCNYIIHNHDIIPKMKEILEDLKIKIEEIRL
ncbi:MAG: hypothetical protein K9W44_16580 [Candidatus Lokiarchaeota archaeon]|nr:hypothetical protein [Candidatus Harpocratesius repetitus]